MKKLFLFFAIVIFAGAVFVYWKGSDTLPLKKDTTRYEDATLPLSFVYKSLGPNSHVVLEQRPSSAVPDMVKTIILMQKEDYESIQRGEREGGEGPPVIALRIYRNPLNLSSRSWAEQNVALSNFNLVLGEVSETKVDGKQALVYENDGLYATRNAILTFNGHVVHASGSYIDKDSDIYRAYDAFLSSLDFQD